ncbi:Outer membrane protein OmpA [Lutibacter oricola]|uniref:Outer membrane protein OmpA n=1 Tax=Lutibacter oricola TaxID=762486 RepID=A0A1H2TRL5_9FLAO|nr:OmpA family protein [Lutibacter oricola]SDW46593.1 Outer membrane protein OmpA [Lutibacter oricola]
MKNIVKKIGLGLCALLVVINFTSCNAVKNANNKQKGAVIGTTAGAGIGAVLGNNLGRGGKGKLGGLIGGVVGGAAGLLIGNKMDKQAQKIEEEIPGATVDRIDDAIVITFDDNSGVHFDSGMYVINTDSRESLNKLARVLIEYPNTNILVEGHTDSAGADNLNFELSKKRAYAVTNYFIHSKKLNSSRFTTKWHGENNPISDNSVASGRAKNRRVNVTIIPDETMINNAKSSTKN